MRLSRPSLLTLLGILLAPLTACPEGQPEFPVVVISVDGLRPEFYLDPAWPAPCLQKLKGQGSWAPSMQSVFPSITYANHSSLVTGVSPARHGIDCNIDFDWETGPKPGWNFEAERLKSPALWNLTRSQGLTCAAFSWPVSVGASVEANIPEIFSIPGANHGTTEELIRETSTPGLIDAIQQGRESFPVSFADWDAWLPGAFAQVWHSYRPQLTLIHMLNLDWTQHRFGPNSPATRQALTELDRHLGEIVEQIDLEKTLVMVVGDHGFCEVRRSLAPNHLFWERGWIQIENGKIRSWKVLARTNGGSAAIYCKDLTLLAAVLDLLREKAPGHWRLIPRGELDQRKTFEGAVVGLAAEKDCTLSGSFQDDFERQLPGPLGQHGHLPEELPTGWIVCGPGILADQNLGPRYLLEVAPTVCEQLGLPHAHMEMAPVPLRKPEWNVR